MSTTPAESTPTTLLITPGWFKQRQLKAESVGPDLYRVAGPNMPEAFLGIRGNERGRFEAYLRTTQDGPDAAVTGQDFATNFDAWEGAFELYRQTMVI